MLFYINVAFILYGRYQYVIIKNFLQFYSNTLENCFKEMLHKPKNDSEKGKASGE